MNRPRSISPGRKSNKKIFKSLHKLDRPRICIKRRLGGIGDVLMSLSSLKAIKDYLPNSYVTYATDVKYMNGSLEKIVRHNPFCDRVIPYKDIRDSEYDLIVDITITGLNKEKPKTIPPNRIDLFAEEIGIESLNDPTPIYEVTEEERKEAKEFLKNKFGAGYKKKKFIVIQARSNDVRRSWPISKVEELANKLAVGNTHVGVFDWKQNHNWSLNDNCFLYNGEIELTAALVEQADLVICPDSSILHLAGALWKPTIAIFGPIAVESRCNHYPTVKPISLKLRCQPCFYLPVCQRSKKTIYMDCLERISVDLVYKEALGLLNKEPEPYTPVEYGKDLTRHKTDNIVLIKRTTAGIGDLVMAMNGIENLTKRFPGKEIHLAIRKNLFPAAENNPYIHKIIDVEKPINLKRYFARFDISIPCAKYESSRIALGKEVQKTRVEIFAEALGTRELVDDILPRFYLTPEEIKCGSKLVQRITEKNRPNICISLQSAEDYRSYPHFEELLELLKFKNMNPIILQLGERIDGYHHFPEKTLREAASILYASDGLITVDTGWLHIAAALKKKIVALFGPIDYRARCKRYQNTKVIIADKKKCIPCWRNSIIKCKLSNTLENSKCLEEISPKLIANTAIDFFRSE